MRRKLTAIMVSVAFSFLTVNSSFLIAQGAVNKDREVEAEADEIFLNDEKNGIEVSTNFDFNTSEGFTKEVISNEMDKNTGIIKPDVEKMLNKAGVLDCEIKEFTDEDIENIENANEITIKSGYCEIDDETGQCTEMDDDEIEEYYEEYYYDNYSPEDKPEIKNTVDKSIADKLLENIGIFPITAYAAYSNSETLTTKGKKFKHTVFLTDTNSIYGKKTAYFKYVVQWLEAPKYCFDDYFTLDTTGLIVKPKDAEYGLKYTCSYKKDMYVVTNGTRKLVLPDIPIEEELDLDKFSYYSSGNQCIVGYHQDLPGVSNGKDTVSVEIFPDIIDYEYCYKDIRLEMSGYVYRENLSDTQFQINADYYHLQEYKPKLKITGIALSLNPANARVKFNIDFSQKKYNELTRKLNAVVDINYFK